MVTRVALLFALPLVLAAGARAESVVPVPTAKPAATAPQPAAAATTESARTVVNPPLPQKRPVISEMTIPAKALFARVKLPSIGKPQAIGYYPRGCLQGGIELPIDGPNWQVMRDARNRNWGHPELIKFLKRFAPLAAKATGWPGILVGDMAQPRGGPLPYGHTSHQVGLDVDIWLTPMPGSAAERETAQHHAAPVPGRARPPARQSEDLDAGRRRLHPHRRRAAAGRAHFRQCRDQEGIVPPRGQAPFRLDGQGAALVRP